MDKLELKKQITIGVILIIIGVFFFTKDLPLRTLLLNILGSSEAVSLALSILFLLITICILNRANIIKIFEIIHKKLKNISRLGCQSIDVKRD